MERVLKLSFIILLLGLLSCKDNFKPDFTEGKATALRNGEEWIGQGRGTVNNQGIGFDMYYDVFDKIGQLRQRLSFRKIPIEYGNYNLFNTSGQAMDSLSGCSFSTASFDGDVVEDRYRLITSEKESTITVHNYNECNRLLSGAFRIKLYIDPNRVKANPANPDTLIFESGTFEVTIEE